ncbi:hypothetical protein BC938DRAFT_471750 [Jimgerdemannia flammicorona]|uniref:Uncharacterized protein n=1 Tax=Jimgerdemannia flammicorona TaxID=994334 RepID=A0A433Q7H7_9FUNG|nr:hypothetical protein BC938DRAFT_471750 [Jimgerdemannia flammicorona]
MYVTDSHPGSGFSRLPHSNANWPPNAASFRNTVRVITIATYNTIHLIPTRSIRHTHSSLPSLLPPTHPSTRFTDTVLAALDKDPTSRDVTDSMPSAGTTTPRRGSNTSRPREVFQSLKARWDKVERGETGAEVGLDDLFDEATMERLASSMHRVTRSLQALIEDFENVQEIDEHITLISQINNTFIDAIITQGDPNTPFPHPSPTNTPAHPDASFMSVSSMSSSLLPSAVPRARPAPQTVLAATVLQLVRNAGGELPFARLKTRIGDVARAQGLNEGQAVQAVYLLVANNLVVIDRSVKGVKEGVVRIV